MHEDLQTNAGTPRGTQLLEEFLDVVPELAKLGPAHEPLAWATINLFAQYWECLLDHVDEHDDKFRFDVVRGLRKLYDLHCQTNVPVACGLLIVALNIRSQPASRRGRPPGPLVDDPADGEGQGRSRRGGGGRRD